MPLWLKIKLCWQDGRDKKLLMFVKSIYNGKRSDSNCIIIYNSLINGDKDERVPNIHFLIKLFIIQKI